MSQDAAIAENTPVEHLSPTGSASNSVYPLPPIRLKEMN
ncbi:hypothetical protein SEUBUCD646_0B04510 [Saccharomyces eubayanus]|uniref:Uncharacterized protein n=1 Tax=Saccharomyces eubayanus TaxID=1080349 RepID=A0ABN8VR45_SACEU|nr:hypothetical protein SEUBUCD650_0B04520 [Saccharomyces eubayanus]CAI1881437.1 hypothetical protein SEUBUCD646_0B04510 [Saccharomyces eubayanus]